MLRPRPVPDKAPKIVNCRDCDEPVVFGILGGPSEFPFTVSRISVSATEAWTLWRHGQTIINIRPRVGGGWEAAEYFGPKAPKRGRLYAEHRCGIWR